MLPEFFTIVHEIKQFHECLQMAPEIHSKLEKFIVFGLWVYIVGPCSECPFLDVAMLLLWSERFVVVEFLYNFGSM